MQRNNETMKQYLSLIKFSHTIFAMPFALLGFFLSVQKMGGEFSLKLLVLVVLCMVFARSAAMAFNRYLDRDIDQKNPRTAVREIPAGIIAPRSALLFVIVNCLLFIGTTWFINRLCFYLSPIALSIILGYSYTKRFTPLCHLVLGAGLALAPLGAYLAVGGGFDLIPILYAASVLTWVSGFDIIYALQDVEFDQSMNLSSIPAAIGKENALKISEALHIVSAALILVCAYLLDNQFPAYSWLNWMAAAIFISLLFYQHTLVKPNDLSKVNLAFFTTNGLASLIFGTLVILDIYI
jgi:4-hydroxybenzoate polyprenyltransferase